MLICTCTEYTAKAKDSQHGRSKRSGWSGFGPTVHSFTDQTFSRDCLHMHAANAGHCGASVSICTSMANYQVTGYVHIWIG